MLSAIFFRSMFILHIFIKLKCENSEGLKEIILNKYEYELNVSRYDLTILNLNTELYDMKYSLMAFINDTNYDLNLFNYYTPFYNHFWLFYISDVTIFEEIIHKYRIKSDYMTIFGIIIPKHLKDKLKRNFDVLNPSIFYVEDNFTKFLEESDFRKNDKMIYFSFDTKKPISRYPEKYLIILSLLIFSLSGIIFMFWLIFYNISKEKNITTIQKYCSIFPILNIIISITLLIKCLYIRGKDPYLHYEYMATIDTIFLSLNTIFKLSLWILLIMFSSGWNIAIKTISKKILLSYCKYGIFIFVFLSMDIFIYNINEKIYNKYCEILNIIFLIIITIIVLIKIKNTVKLLYKKLYYAQTLIPEFTEGLLFKLKLFSKVKVMIIIYPIPNILLFLMHLFIPGIYVSICLKFINYYFLNMVFLINLLIILGPKSLPKNYDVDFAKDLENDPGKIYKYNILLNSEDEIILNDLTKNEIRKIKKKNNPILIFGPTLNQNNNNSYNYRYNFFINSVEDEKDINRFYTNLQIGFFE